jgi:hypothetical protein
LYADKISMLIVHPLHKAFFGRGANAIEIGRNDA